MLVSGRVCLELFQTVESNSNILDMSVDKQTSI